MPLGGRPLSAAQITLIRRWIAEGAKEDPDTTEKYELRLAGLRSQPLKIQARVPYQSYLILTVRGAGKREVLYTDVASVKSPQERGDSGTPGEWISWDLRPGKHWPRRITVELTVAYSQSEPWGAELVATTSGGPERSLARAVLKANRR